MAKSRFILHPILNNKRSRIIFFWFFLLSFSLTVYLWFQKVFFLRKLDIQAHQIDEAGGLVSMLFSSITTFSFLLLSILLAAGLTSKHIIGPVNRIVDWLHDWKQGHRLSPLVVREGDKFAKLVVLLNQLYDKIHSSSPR